MNHHTSAEITVLVLLVIFVIYNLINYVLVKPLLTMLYGKYKTEAAALENSSSIPEAFIKNSGISEERAILEILSHRRNKKFDLNLVIANIEFALIAGSTFVILNKFGDKIDYDFLSRIAFIVLAWMGIKVIGNYGQWKRPIFGRSTFYVFLIGTTANIIVGILAGWILAGII
jgi:hypothetical protein